MTVCYLARRGNIEVIRLNDTTQSAPSSTGIRLPGHSARAGRRGWLSGGEFPSLQLEEWAMERSNCSQQDGLLQMWKTLSIHVLRSIIDVCKFKEREHPPLHPMRTSIPHSTVANCVQYRDVRGVGATITQHFRIIYS